MPELTTKLGIKKPLGNETVSRAAFNDNWDIIDANAQKNIIQSNTAPASPVLGDLWIDTSTTPNSLKKYNGTDWDIVGAVTPEQIGAVKNNGGVPSIQAGLDAEKPTAGATGQIYIATDTQLIYKDTGTAWQKVGAVKWGDIEGKPDLALAADLAAHLAETAADNVHGLGFRGVLLRRTSSQSIPNAEETNITWDMAIYDTGSFFNTDNPSRITIPSGVNKVRLVANIQFPSNSSGTRQVAIMRNGASFWGMPVHSQLPAEALGYTQINICSPVLNVVSGDYFECYVFQTSGAALDVLGFERTWFHLEVIE